jgi:hypothetical protein
MGRGQAIRRPRPLLDKLGVKPGARVSVVGVETTGFLDELSARGADVSARRTRKGTDLVFVGMSGLKLVIPVARR